MKLHIKGLLISAAFGLSGCFYQGCFVAGTLVDTPDGPRPIDALKRGDVVWAWSEAEGARVRRRIEATHRNLAQVVCRVEVGDDVIPGVTPEHPFFHVDAGEFVAFRDLPTDALLLTVVDGEPRPTRISGLQVTEHLEPCVMVFNLTVEGPEHTYFAEGVLVHNKPPGVYCPDGSWTAVGCGEDTYSPDSWVDPDAIQVTVDAGPTADAEPPPTLSEADQATIAGLCATMCERAQVLCANPAPADPEAEVADCISDCIDPGMNGSLAKMAASDPECPEIVETYYSCLEGLTCEELLQRFSSFPPDVTHVCYPSYYALGETCIGDWADLPPLEPPPDGS